MTLKYYMDEHVPTAITDGLHARGIDVLTVQSDGRIGESDVELLDRASDLARALFTHDTDFLQEAAARQESGDFFSGVIYAHQLRITIGQSVSDLELLSRCCEPADLENQIEYLPLR